MPHQQIAVGKSGVSRYKRMRSWVLSLMVVATKNIHPTLLLFASDYANDKSFCWVQSMLHEYVKKVTQPWQTSTILSFFNQPFLTCCIDYSQKKYKSAYFGSLHHVHQVSSVEKLISIPSELRRQQNDKQENIFSYHHDFYNYHLHSNSKPGWRS